MAQKGSGTEILLRTTAQFRQKHSVKASNLLQSRSRV